MNIVEFAKDEMIIREGFREQKAYLIQDGRVKIFRTINGKRIELAILGKNQIFGEMALFDDRPRSASAVALEPTRALVFYKELVESEMAKMASWMHGFMKIVVSRLRVANSTINPLQLENYLYGIMQIIKLKLDMAIGNEKNRNRPVFLGKIEIDQLFKSMFLPPSETFETIIKSLEVFHLILIENDENGVLHYRVNDSGLIDSAVELLGAQLAEPTPDQLQERRKVLDFKINILSQVLRYHQQYHKDKQKHHFEPSRIEIYGKRMDPVGLNHLLKDHGMDDMFPVVDDLYHYEYQTIKDQLLKYSTERNVISLICKYSGGGIESEE